MRLNRGTRRVCSASGSRMPSYGTKLLPSRDEALAAPLSAFRSWFLRIECARCQRERYLAETYMTLAGFGDQSVGDLLARLRHDGCCGQPEFVELITGIPGASRPVRRIVLIEHDGR
jgi:hypothetical protein